MDIGKNPHSLQTDKLGKIQLALLLYQPGNRELPLIDVNLGHGTIMKNRKLIGQLLTGWHTVSA